MRTPGPRSRVAALVVTLALAGAPVATPRPLAAQVMMSWSADPGWWVSFWHQQMFNTTQQFIFNSIRMNGGTGGLLDAELSDSAAALPAAARALPAATALRFAHTPEAARGVVDAYVGRIAADDPEGARDFRRAMAERDVGAVFRATFGPAGLRPDDAADVATGLAVLQWMAARDVRTLGAAQMRRVAAARAQFARALAPLPPLAEPAQRREFGEELLLQVALLQSGWRSAIASGDAGKLGQLRDGAAEAFRQLTGADASDLVLTDAGFARR